MHRPDLALLIAFVFSFFSRFGFCYQESPWQPSYDYYHIDLGELGGHHGGVGVKVPVPKDVMVDVINDLGIKLLAIHNERNDNNIAISPYGALSVLAALSEGLQGDAVHEILHAAHIPKDKHIIRVGLRDIHRHLKSYFIPEEGFLAGLTLNLNNVTLRSDYEDVLRFYGFDYGSFNNALYPEPLTTQKPSERTTLGTTLGLSEGTTIGTTQKIEDTTIVLTDTRLGDVTTETTQGTTGKEVTTTLLNTIQGRDETTTVKEEATTTIDTTVAPTTLLSYTMTPTMTTVITETTTQGVTSTVPETTTVKAQETTIKELLQTSESSSEKTTEATTTTTQQESTTESPTTTTEESKTTTDKAATETVSITTKISKVTTKISESSFEFSAISTNLIETTTAMLTTGQSMRTEAPTTAVEQTTTQKITTIPTEVPETTTQKVTTIPTEIPIATTKFLFTTTESQTTTTETGTTVPMTMASDITTTTPSATTTESAETTIITQKTSDTQRTTRQVTAMIMTSDQLTTLPLGETTLSDEETTVSLGEATVPLGENTLSDGETTVSLRDPTVSLGETTMSIGETTLLIGETTVPVGETTQTTVVSDFRTNIPNESTTILASTAESTTILTTQTPQETTVALLEDTVIPNVNPATLSEGADVQNDFIDVPVNTATEFFDQLSGDLETTTPFFFGTTPDFQDMTTFDQDDFEYNYNYDVSTPLNNNSALDQVSPVYDDNMANLVNNNLMQDTPEGASFNRNLKRRARSVVDYVIARYYDDHHPYAAPPPRPAYGTQQEPPQRPQYLPQSELPLRPQYVPQQEPLTFAVYGKYRESGINFMKYDTVLPFFFVSNLKALALSFPLDSTKYYLLLLLPVEDNGVDQLVCDLRLHGNLRYIIEHLRLTHVVATIPSFKLKGYVTLTPLMQRLGIRRIFEPRQADFSPMTNVTDIYVTNIEQAVTVTIRNYLDPSAQHYKNFRQYSPVHFKADHPFLYFVIDSELHVALMVGKVINPLNSRIR